MVGVEAIWPIKVYGFSSRAIRRLDGSKEILALLSVPVLVDGIQRRASIEEVRRHGRFRPRLVRMAVHCA